MKKIINESKYFIKNNKLFFIFIILYVLCSLVLRINTSHNISINPLLFDIGVSLLIGSFSFLLKTNNQYKYLLISLIILSIICIINSIYYEFYSSYVSFSLITVLGQAKEVSSAVYDNIKLIEFIYILFPIVFILINKYYLKKDFFNFLARLLNNKKFFKESIIISAVVLGFSSLVVNGGAWSCLAKEWNREYIVNHFGITIYQVNDLINTLRPKIDSWFGYDVAYKKFVDYYIDNKIKKSNNEYTNKYEGYNIVFVHMESIMSFLVNLKINNIEITPNINKLTTEGMYFSNFYPQISAGTSSDTEFTLSTSLMPVSSGTVFVSYFDREYPTMQKLLKNKGYYTFSMHGNKASMWNRNKMHPNLGYMDFYSESSFDIDEKVGLGLSDKSFFRQAMPILENIEEHNKNYMGSIITLSNHTPFDNDELFEQIDLTYKTRIYNENTNRYEDVTFDYLEGTKLGDYIRSAHYADEALGDFINYINESDYFDKTLFIFYGDHDPKLSINEFINYYNYDFNTGEILKSNDENYYNYDYYANELNKKTPLIIWNKKEKLELEVPYYMGMIDVMPTIGNLVNIYNEYALGHDIFEIKDKNVVVFANGDYLTNKVYYRGSKEEYKPLTLDDILSEDYIKNNKSYADTILEVSDGIIRHDLIKASKNKDNIEELK